MDRGPKTLGILVWRLSLCLFVFVKEVEEPVGPFQLISGVWELLRTFLEIHGSEILFSWLF